MWYPCDFCLPTSPTLEAWAGQAPVLVWPAAVCPGPRPGQGSNTLAAGPAVPCGRKQWGEPAAGWRET